MSEYTITSSGAAALPKQTKTNNSSDVQIWAGINTQEAVVLQSPNKNKLLQTSLAKVTSYPTDKSTGSCYRLTDRSSSHLPAGCTSFLHHQTSSFIHYFTAGNKNKPSKKSWNQTCTYKNRRKQMWHPFTVKKIIKILCLNLPWAETSSRLLIYLFLY